MYNVTGQDLSIANSGEDYSIQNAAFDAFRAFYPFIAAASAYNAPLLAREVATKVDGALDAAVKFFLPPVAEAAPSRVEADTGEGKKDTVVVKSVKFPVEDGVFDLEIGIGKNIEFSGAPGVKEVNFVKGSCPKNEDGAEQCGVKDIPRLILSESSAEAKEPEKALEK